MITDSTYHSTWMISRYPTAIQIGIRQYKYCRKIHPEQRLQVLHKRTSMLHFTKLSIPPPIELRLVNIRIQKSETAKDLGRARRRAFGRLDRLGHLLFWEKLIIIFFVDVVHMYSFLFFHFFQIKKGGVVILWKRYFGERVASFICYSFAVFVMCWK